MPPGLAEEIRSDLREMLALSLHQQAGAIQPYCVVHLMLFAEVEPHTRCALRAHRQANELGLYVRATKHVCTCAQNPLPALLQSIWIGFNRQVDASAHRGPVWLRPPPRLQLQQVGLEELHRGSQV